MYYRTKTMHTCNYITEANNTCIVCTYHYAMSTVFTYNLPRIVDIMSPHVALSNIVTLVTEVNLFP